MELKKGYKLTELGVIPKDWIEASFEEVMSGFSSGQTPYRGNESYYTGNIPWITSGELNHRIITDTNEKITEEAVLKTNLKILPEGTFLIAITGLEAEGTRGSCGITGIKAATNQSCMVLYPKEGVLSTEYLFHYYNLYGDWLAFRYCQGTKQQSYTGSIAKKLPIILPPTLAEQSAIATALSESDALIEKLEKLIEKKKAIKQGTMQELLRPKKGWVAKALNTILDYEQPTHYIVKSTEYNDNDPVPVLTAGKTFILGKTNEDFGIFKSYPVILFDDFTTALKLVNFEFKVKSSAIKILKSRSAQYDIRFIFAMMQQIKYPLGDHKRNWIGEYSKIEIIIPDSFREQQEIATILSDMDTEIESLEAKLSKYKLVKMGMMQELLTGKTRLI